MNVGASVKAKLRDRAEQENRTYQEIMTVYGLERTLYRLSVSPYSHQFILKGGILLYAWYQGNFTRGTADVDFLADHIPNDLEIIKKAFENIFQITCPDDGIVFDIQTLRAERIAEFKKYPGIHLSVLGFLERTQISIQVDIGFGDVIFPAKTTMEYPTLLDQRAPILETYSKETVIAEKFEVIVSLGKANSRYKDYYDIYALSESFDFENESLETALIETFANRHTPFDFIIAFEKGFATDSDRKRIWASFLKAKNITTGPTFELVVQRIQTFLSPIVESIGNSTTELKAWNHLSGEWKTMDDSRALKNPEK